MPAPDDVARAARRRTKVLKLIRKSIADRGYPPSVSEIARETKVSTLTTRRDLSALEADGKIERDPKVGRGIRIVEEAK